MKCQIGAQHAHGVVEKGRSHVPHFKKICSPGEKSRLILINWRKAIYYCIVWCDKRSREAGGLKSLFMEVVLEPQLESRDL